MTGAGGGPGSRGSRILTSVREALAPSPLPDRLVERLRPHGTAPATVGTEHTIFGDRIPASLPLVPDTRPSEVGVRLEAVVDGWVVGVRHYDPAVSPGPRVGTLWTARGRSLASAPLPDAGAAGWVEARFERPVPVRAGTVLVASCFAPHGGWARSVDHFTCIGDGDGPVRALSADEAHGNGVHRFGRRSAFPTTSRRAANHWVDVVFRPAVPWPDAPAEPMVRHPAPGATLVPVGTTTAAIFPVPVGEPIVVGLTDWRGRDVPGTSTIEDGGRTVRFTPAVPLDDHTTYTALVAPADVAAARWTFVTAPGPAPGPDDGPGGAVLVVGGGTATFDRYYGEVLRTEGIGAWSYVDVDELDAEVLAGREVVLLAPVEVDARGVELLTAFVRGAGGHLVAMRPHAVLEPLLGLGPAAHTIEGGLLRIDPDRAPGAGLHDGAIRFHGEAVIRPAQGAEVAATLLSAHGVRPLGPAVTVRRFPSGGTASAFAYDLAEAIVLARQGNPAWVDDSRTGATPRRSTDLFFGAAAHDPQPDWVDLDTLHVPVADVQQRLLVNLLLWATAETAPLPRAAYLPHGGRAVVVLTGDAHPRNNRTTRHFADHRSWGARSTSYVWVDASSDPDEAATAVARGFEVALHLDPNGCRDFDGEVLEAALASQLGAFATAHPRVPAPVTNRNHCVAWSGWTTVPEGERRYGIRLDTTYYHHPERWLRGRAGFVNGSALPMRFARLDGSVVDVFQAATQMTDESGNRYPSTVEELLDRAVGPEGFRGVYVANVHTDFHPRRYGKEIPSEAIVAAARARGVPVTSAAGLLAWLDGRERSLPRAVGWDGHRLCYVVDPTDGAEGITILLPTEVRGGRLEGVSVDGEPVVTRAEVVDGVPCTLVDAGPGAHEAWYG